MLSKCKNIRVVVKKKNDFTFLEGVNLPTHYKISPKISTRHLKVKIKIVNLGYFEQLFNYSCHSTGKQTIRTSQQLLFVVEKKKPNYIYYSIDNIPLKFHRQFILG